MADGASARTALARLFADFLPLRIQFGSEQWLELSDPREVTHIAGAAADGSLVEIRLTPPGVAARNDAFDVTPARLITGLITERGVCAASREGLLGLYPEEDHA
mgnify:CR=1 FL=1